jgi:hypothetical protein
MNNITHVCNWTLIEVLNQQVKFEPNHVLKYMKVP